MDRFKAEICLHDCALKSHGIVNEAGDVDKEKLKKLAHSYIKDESEFHKILSEGIDNCHEIYCNV